MKKAIVVEILRSTSLFLSARSGLHNVLPSVRPEKTAEIIALIHITTFTTLSFASCVENNKMHCTYNKYDKPVMVAQFAIVNYKILVYNSYWYSCALRFVK